MEKLGKDGSRLGLQIILIGIENMRFRTRNFYILFLIIVGSIASLIWFYLPRNITPIQENNIDLIDIKQNISNYMKNVTVFFYVIDIKVRPDPEKWLLENYYLITIKDINENNATFVISETSLKIYELYLGRKAVFKLQGIITPILTPPYRRLITNILYSIPIDPNDPSLGYYVIKIYLLHNGGNY